MHSDLRRKALGCQCEVPDVDHSIRLEEYIRIAKSLYSQGESYFRQAEWDYAYIYLKRYTRLSLHVIPSHHSYCATSPSTQRTWIKQKCREALLMLEETVAKMEAEYCSEDDDFIIGYVSESNEIIVENKQEHSSDDVRRDLERRLNSLKIGNLSNDRKNPSLDKNTLNILRLQPEPTGFHSTLTSSSLPNNSRIKYPTLGNFHPLRNSLNSSNESIVSDKNRQLYRRESFNKAVSGNLRELVICSDIISQFTHIAEPNTRQPPHGIETCGILAGQLQGYSLLITTLIIPKQHGTSDMCTMTNEEELFDYCMEHNLLTLGWIHTHPEQQCFLSSVDLHTHCGFQSILPEAIAIVIAPKDHLKDIGIFRLTTPTGLQLIQRCMATGFHPHPDNIEIYSDALQCTWTSSNSANVIDLR